MAATTTRRSTNSRSSSRKTTPRASAGTRGTARKTTPRRSTAAKKRSAPRSTGSNGRARSKPSTNGVGGALSGVGSTVESTVGKVGSSVGKVGDSVGTAAQKAKMPALLGTAAAAGLAGGLALRSHMLSPRKVAGIPVGRARPLKSIVREAQHVGKEIGKAGFRLGVGDLDMEVQRNKKRNSSKRDSPLEVLIKGLTTRSSSRS